MRYFGGKSRTAKEIVEVILRHTNDREGVIEPFCGGLNITIELLKYFNYVIASDISLPVISLYQKMQKNPEGEFLPSNVTQEVYDNAIKLSDDDALKAFYLVGCAFGGKYSGGLARSGSRNYALNAKNSLIKKFKQIKHSNCLFENKNYEDYSGVRDSIIYCDPPYVNTHCGYIGKKFDSEKFWEWVKQMSERGNVIFVSEYTAPGFATCIWEKPVRTDMHGKGRSDGRKEKLFLVKEEKS